MMSAHPQVLARLAVLLTETTDPDQRDRLLDQWLDAEQRATEHDAREWGFPHGWCIRERRELLRRARHSTGVVPLDDALDAQQP